MKEQFSRMTNELRKAYKNVKTSIAKQEIDEAIKKVKGSWLNIVLDTNILAALIASKANYLVSGDHDLLVLSEQYPILSPAEFCDKFFTLSFS